MRKSARHPRARSSKKNLGETQIDQIHEDETMSYATQITVVSGRLGSRRSKAFILGVTSRKHREIVRELLNQEALDKIENDNVDGGIELDAFRLTHALKNDGHLIESIGDGGLRQPLQEFRDYWLSLDDRDNAFAIAELAA